MSVHGSSDLTQVRKKRSEGIKVDDHMNSKGFIVHGKSLRPTNKRFFCRTSQHLRIWGILQYFLYDKTINTDKNLAHKRSYPFVSFHFPWNDDAMVEVFLESLELWISTAVDQMLGSKKIQLLFYAQNSWFLFNKTMCHSQKAYWKTVFKNHSLRQSLRPVSASFWTNGRPFSAWLSEFANIIPSS